MHTVLVFYIQRQTLPGNAGACIKRRPAHAMDTIPEDEVLRLRSVMRALAVGSAVVHGALCVYCLVKHLEAPSVSQNRFALYTARVSSELASTPPSASFARDLERAYASTCASAPNATGPLVLLSPELRQSWLPERAGLAVDGFVLLAAEFCVSCAAQCFYAYTTLREQALETFRQPCLLRALEYGLTSPLQLALVAMCVLVRDVHTLGLLVAAQAAGVLLGFALEYALGSADLEDPLEHTIMARSPPALAVPCELRIGTLVCGPSLDERYMRSHEQRAARAFELCFAVSFLLHVAVWAVLLGQLLGLEAALCAPAPAAQLWVDPLRRLVVGQCALSSCLKLVPLLQSFWMWAGDADAASAFLYGSVAYAVLGVVAKSLLLAAYVAFVQLLPLA